jgi:hypothetical protein
MAPSLKPRERDTILQALRAGVVPRLGLQHIQVGRAREIEEMVRDMDRVAEGGGAIRFVIGDYGSGKTFFLNLVRLIALQKGLVVMSADLAPDRRLHASGGQARALYAELARNLATRTRPEGAALGSVVERFISQAQGESQTTGQPVDAVIQRRLSHLSDLTGGYDFATAVRRYWDGYEAGDETLKAAALRWLRAEYATRTDARAALGVRTIIDDANVYDSLKLMAALAREAGYSGLLVTFDEMVNLCRLASGQARRSNYEQILRILNDLIQGSAAHFGVLMGGTPEFLMDTRRGLYSYEALQSRLAENSFARDGLVDLSGPVIRLPALTPEDLFVLLANIRRVAFDDPTHLPDEALEVFMRRCQSRLGDAYFRTPREVTKAFVDMIAILQQNQGVGWADLVEKVEIAPIGGEDMSDIDDAAYERPTQASGADDLAAFKL